MAERYMGGSAPQRIEWVAESEEGVTPTDPAWNPLSQTVETFPNMEPEASTEPLTGVGDSTASDFYNGPLEIEGSFEYYLNQWFVDGSGNTVDPSWDAMTRGGDNRVSATHTYLMREEHATGGADGGGRRVYAIGKGGHPGEVVVPFETENGLPILVELTYQFEKARAYSIDQPSSSTTLVVKSSSSDDTSQSVTIESEGASTTETLTLNGTSMVASTSSFGDIDAISLSAETVGDVTVAINSGTESSPSEGTTLSQIRGQNFYPYDEGDLGVPALGAGSRATEPSGDFITFNSDVIQYTGGESIAAELVSGELSVSQNLDSNSQQGTDRMNIHAQIREIILSADLAGPTVLVDQWEDYFGEVPHDIVWTAEGYGTVTMSGMHITTPGEDARESGQAKLIMSTEWSGTGISATASSS